MTGVQTVLFRSVAYLGNNDPTTQRMIKEILAMEEEHADDMASLLEGFKA